MNCPRNTTTDFETVIGLEVHVQLCTKSKMYCRCAADYSNAKPNTHVCPLCLGIPGTLPILNKKAIEYIVMTALSLNCSIANYSKFDRKNYFYPDLMKGYQITQFDKPIGYGGWLDICVDGISKRVGIARVHQEEDVAKLHHRIKDSKAYSLMDMNRSGMPLIEIVSEPDMRSAEEARMYLQKLHSILRYLGVSTANMEEGSFRCDANISIRPRGCEALSTKVEVKNMNSFRAVSRALEYEANRQQSVLADGGRVTQETRGWMEAEGKTISQRSKEFAHDYRYFPEPDIPPITLSKEWVDSVKSKLPELREARMNRFVDQYGLPQYDANLLTERRETADYFETLMRERMEIPPKDISNWLVGHASEIMNASGCDIVEFGKRIAPSSFIGLVGLVNNESINNSTGKTVLEEMFLTSKLPQTIIEEKGLTQISDSSELEAVARQVLLDNPQAVADYKAGKTQSIKFLIGQLMKLSKGRANPKIAGEIISRLVEEI